MPAIEYEHDALLLGASGRTLSTQPGIYKGHKIMTRKSLKKPSYIGNCYQCNSWNFPDLWYGHDTSILSSRGATFEENLKNGSYIYGLIGFIHSDDNAMATGFYPVVQTMLFANSGEQGGTEGAYSSMTTPFILIPKSRISTG